MSIGFDAGRSERLAPLSRRHDTRVLVVDDDRLERAAIRAIVEADEDLVVIGLCDTVDGPGRVAGAAPDVVLLAADLRGFAGRRELAAILAASARTRVLVLSEVSDPGALLETLASGGSGYLLKSAIGTRLVRAIHDVMDGRVPIDGEVVEAMRERLGRPAPIAGVDTSGPHPLTPRELTVLGHVAAGMTNEQIAAELVLSSGTVKLHVQHIIAKLGVANRTQAAVYAAQRGLLISR